MARVINCILCGIKNVWKCLKFNFVNSAKTLILSFTVLHSPSFSSAPWWEWICLRKQLVSSWRRSSTTLPWLWRNLRGPSWRSLEGESSSVQDIIKCGSRWSDWMQRPTEFMKFSLRDQSLSTFYQMSNHSTEVNTLTQNLINNETANILSSATMVAK